MWFFVVLLYLLYLFIVQPFYTPQIQTIEYNTIEKGFVFWIESIFLGFIFIHHYYSLFVKKWFKYTLFIYVLISLILPHALLSVDGNLSFIWNFGLVSNGKVRYDYIGGVNAACYALTVLFPPIVIASLRGQILSIGYWIPIVLYIMILYGIDIYWVVTSILIAADLTGGILSIGFVVCPLIFNILASTRLIIDSSGRVDDFLNNKMLP